MPHIHTEPGQYDHTVSAYIIRTDGKTPTLMLHRHKKLKKYMQFGGHIELDENPWNAIVHELLEETGYTIDQLQVLQPRLRLTNLTNALLHPYPLSYQTVRFGELDHYHTDVAFAFIANQPPRDTIGDGESQIIKSFTAEALKAIPAVDIPENVREIGLFILEKCLTELTPIDSKIFLR